MRQENIRAIQIFRAQTLRALNTLLHRSYLTNSFDLSLKILISFLLTKINIC